jgi:hypothetical protein
MGPEIRRRAFVLSERARALGVLMAGKLFVAFLALVYVAVGAATSVNASCAGTPPSISQEIGNARVVFVGTVLYTSDNNRTARVRVESIWKGPALPIYENVHGEAPGSGPFSGSEADHLYKQGQRYLFGPLNTSSPFVDYGECGTLSQPYTAELATYAPPDARAPTPAMLVDQAESAVGQYWLPALLVTVVVAIGVAVLLRTRG